MKTDLLRDGAVSRLYIARASKADSGNYTCGMRNAQTSVMVHILNGSWLRRHDDDTPHLLTFGLTTYSNDARIQVFHEQPNDWKLQIQYPTAARDEGLYECMVSSNPPILKRTRLTVVGE